MSDTSNTPKIGTGRHPASPPEEQIPPYLYTEQLETLTANSGELTNWTTEEMPFLRSAPAGMPMQQEVADRAACAWLQQRLASLSGTPHTPPRTAQELHHRINEPTQQGIRCDARAARQGQSVVQPRVVNRGPENWGPAPPSPGDIPPGVQAPLPPWRAGRLAAAPPAGGGVTVGGNRLPKLPPNFIL